MEYLLQLDMLDMESLKDMLDKEYLQTLLHKPELCTIRMASSGKMCVDSGTPIAMHLDSTSLIFWWCF